MNVLKSIVWAFIIITAFYGVMQLVSDEPQPPEITYPAIALSCPIAHGC